MNQGTVVLWEQACIGEEILVVNILKVPVTLVSRQPWKLCINMVSGVSRNLSVSAVSSPRVTVISCDGGLIIQQKTKGTGTKLHLGTLSPVPFAQRPLTHVHTAKKWTIKKNFEIRELIIKRMQNDVKRFYVRMFHMRLERLNNDTKQR